MKTLFIGGPADGRRIDVPREISHWVVPELVAPIPFPIGNEGTEAFKESCMTQNKYVREKLEPGGFTVFLHEHMDAEDMISILLEGYRKPRED